LIKSVVDKFANCEYPWQIIPDIKKLVTIVAEGYTEIEKGIFVGKNVKIAPTAYIEAPTVIGDGTEIRHSAYIRGNVIIGENCVVGNSTEIKNDIIFNNVQVPHYNYVGDSILGYKSHMGAGSITSNVKSDKTLVVVKDCYDTKEEIETGLKKFGAMLGDYVEVGCNSVLNPGTVIGKNSNVYPTSCVRGVIPANHIFKNKDAVIAKK
jgi:NDP-sugar pyrophosphorylase family protein